jgi:glucoamylase
MSVSTQTRASSFISGVALDKQSPQLSTANINYSVIAQHMYDLLLRNISTDGYNFIHPENQFHPNVTDNLNQLQGPFILSAPGCVIAAPSFSANTAGVNQDYVYHWVRDSAITLFEVIAASQPLALGQTVPTLIDYVNFTKTCQNNAHPSPGLPNITLGHACFTIDGRPRDWTEQNDGPALQNIAILQAYTRLDPATQAVAKEIIQINLNFLLAVYQNPTFNLWEEHSGYSFFARSVQLRSFIAIKNNTIGIAKPATLDVAISWLQNALAQHWNGQYYLSVINEPAQPVVSFYDPNIDIIGASLYGAISRTDPKLLATAAHLRSLWADDNSTEVYPINQADRSLGYGPLLGRYPGDVYDGGSSSLGKHPWALCSLNLAELYFGLAQDLGNAQVNVNLTTLIDNLSKPFFDQVGVNSGMSNSQAGQLLLAAGDAILKAVLYHSDHLELSEQFDGVYGFEKSVKNLTWSYAAFLSAVRARNGVYIEG